MALPTVTVVVLGDIGRSPRMQYHAQSFLRERFKVNLIGYGGSKPTEYLNSHSNCMIKCIPETPGFTKSLPVLLAYLFKILWQTLTLFWALVMSERPRHLLVQSPPSIPALMVCYLYCRMVGARFCIDWHNYGFSIMALTHGQNHKIVKISEVFEGYFGSKADVSLCVTEAMKEDLERRWGIKARTLYDRPPEHFGSIPDFEKEVLLSKYKELSSAFLSENGVVRSDRPGLLVSSTSWTEDEDFSILLSALQEYERSKQTNLPKLVCVITGKGPLKDHYMREVSAQQWSRVKIISLWLEIEDYPKMLASADLGVSLHSSSSGLDLPMKVVDMFGCGLPVAALDFPCLKELVRHGENGLVFENSTQLSEQLQKWFGELPVSDSKANFQKQIKLFQSLRWHDNWKSQAFPLFNVQ